MANLTWEMIPLKLRNPFRLSYGVTDTRQAFWVRLKGDEGWGEGTIAPYYGITPEALAACWQAAAEKEEPFPDAVEEIAVWVGTQGPATARTALELALYDRIGRNWGVPLYQLLGLPQPSPMPTSFTIAIDTPEAMAQMAAQIGGYPIIKVKLGSEDDEARLGAIRAARPDARLRVDANAGWTLEAAYQHVAALEKFNLEMIEQPLAWDQIEAMGQLQRATSIPIVADESVQSLEHVERLAAAGVAGINLKLMKVGGVTLANRMLKRAVELGMRVMLGCMIETSIGTTAMLHMAGLAEWIDLDAPMLISNDPFDGLRYDEHAVASLPQDRAGIGAVLKN